MLGGQGNRVGIDRWYFTSDTSQSIAIVAVACQLGMLPRRDGHCYYKQMWC